MTSGAGRKGAIAIKIRTSDSDSRTNRREKYTDEGAMRAEGHDECPETPAPRCWQHAQVANEQADRRGGDLVGRRGHDRQRVRAWPRRVVNRPLGRLLTSFLVLLGSVLSVCALGLLGISSAVSRYGLSGTSKPSRWHSRCGSLNRICAAPLTRGRRKSVAGLVQVPASRSVETWMYRPARGSRQAAGARWRSRMYAIPRAGTTANISGSTASPL